MKVKVWELAALSTMRISTLETYHMIDPERDTAVPPTKLSVASSAGAEKLTDLREV